jgi:uncharacterized protein YukE
VPPLELEEIKAVGAGKASLAKAEERINTVRSDSDGGRSAWCLAQTGESVASVAGDVESVHTNIEHLRADMKQAADAAEDTTQKVAELAERVAQLQDGADGNGDVAGLQAAIKELEAELNGCKQSLKQAQKAIEGRQELQVGTTRFQGCKSKRFCPCSYGLCPRLRSRHCRVARGSGAVSGGFASPQDLPRAVLVIHGAIVFLFMVLTISVIEGMR